MASHPPFQVEDQTDEDFFDKLVNEDDDDDVGLKATATSSSVYSAPVFTDGDESDEIKAFANLSVNESEDIGVNEKKMATDDSGGKFESEPNGEVKEFVEGDTKEIVEREQVVEEECNGALESTNSFDFGALESSNSFDFGALESAKSFEFASVVEGNNQNAGAEVLSNSTVGDSSQSGAVGVKEVQWSSFSTNRENNQSTGFGSYSDFFSELGENAGEPSGDVANNFGFEATAVAGNEVHDSGYMQTSIYGNYQDGYNYGTDAQQATGVQDQNSLEYLESLYPGWKVDPTTGQWYKVDDFNLGANVQGIADSNLSGNWAASDGKTDVSYLQNSVQSVTGTVAASGTSATVTNWNQVSHLNDATGSESNWNQLSQASDTGGSTLGWNKVSPENNEYPPHMVFDPQYPDWYYDTNAQEWRKLETYITSLQSAAETQNQVSQNETIPIDAFSGHDNQRISDKHGHVGNNYSLQGSGAEAQGYNRAVSFDHYNQQSPHIWQPETAVNNTRSSSDYRKSQQLENQYGQNFGGSNHTQQQLSGGYGGTVPYYEKASEVQNQFSAIGEPQNFVNGGNFSQQFNQPRNEQKEQNHVSRDYFSFQNSVNFSQTQVHGAHQFSHAPTPARSSAGRPPCALVTFGFGGKLIVAKGSDSGASAFGSQVPVGSSISVLNFMEVVAENVDASDYFRALCRQSFPGPLSGGSAGVNKWIDEKISNFESTDLNYRKGEVLRLLLSLLKISVQYQGKLRSPFGADSLLKENEVEAAVAKLFASPGMNGAQFGDYGSIAHCLQKLPSEGQLRAAAAEVQSLLVCGRKKEALHCAQEGQLWGPALVLAAQLGDQFYVDTVKQMALRQLVAGSPLRTLCLLIAGQPADVFNADASSNNSMYGTANITQQHTQFGVTGMLHDWKENLAVITANRTKDDELVLMHLGDCLWKENGDVVAAHMCYLVAEGSFEPYSGKTRLCLLGVDHWKFPRTYASPEAIQRTEIYEYSKVLGNPQFILLPFQPYKLVYAHMLVEVGRVSDALKYCQAVLKALKNGRSPEVETLRQLASSLEDRIKSYQQGGFTANLAPGKLVGKLLNLFDSTAHRVVGGLPPVPSTSGGSVQSTENHYQTEPRVFTSQSTMAMSSLVPSGSMEPINEWARPKHNRSVSEPDFGRTPRQDQVDRSKTEFFTNAPGESSGGGTSRFGRFSFGSQIFQKTVGLVLKPRQGRQAKLGDENKFYFDKQLNTWVEKGAEPPAMETVLPPPPTAAFQNGTSDYNLKTALKSEGSLSNGSPEFKSPSLDQGAGIPPLPPTSNQFSARSRMGVRSRYVDTFNKGGGNQTNLFQSPSVSSVKPSTRVNANAKFFVPAPISSSEETTGNNTESIQDTNIHNENPSISSVEDSFHSPPPPSSVNMQRFGSMGSIPSQITTVKGSFLADSRRTASWSGSFHGSFSPESADVKPLGEVLAMHQSSTPPGDSSLMHSSSGGGSFGDVLHEVEL